MKFNLILCDISFTIRFQLKEPIDAKKRKYYHILILTRDIVTNHSYSDISRIGILLMYYLTAKYSPALYVSVKQLNFRTHCNFLFNMIT